MAVSQGSEQAGFGARRIMRATRVGSLATSSPGGGPFVSLVTPVTAADGSVLLLLSDLADHTRHLMAEPRCAVLFVGPPVETNPQTAPRVTVTGTAVPDGDAASRARYLAVQPYAALYAGFTDFRLWRIKPEAGRMVEGFARARHLSAADFAPDAGLVASLLSAAADIMTHCNEDHPDALARIAGEAGAWRMVAVDVDGCDLALGEQVTRVAWSAPLRSPDDARRELVRLARAGGTGSPDAG